MSEEQAPKKHRKREKQFDYRTGDRHDNRGRKAGQKMKPFLTLVHFWKQSDENHILSARDIDDSLWEFDVEAERRSIYRDIKEINKVMLPLEGECSYWDVEELLENDETGEFKTIIYDPRRKRLLLATPSFGFH